MYFTVTNGVSKKLNTCICKGNSGEFSSNSWVDTLGTQGH